MQGCARSVWRLAVLAAALVAVPVVAIAQPPASGALASVSQAATAQPSRQELNPAARIMTAPAVQQDIFSPEPPGPCPLKDSTVSFTLTSVTLKGATALPAAQLARAYRRRIGQRLAVAAICDIRDRVARIMFDRGILARVEIPAQTIAGGALTLEVIEAHVVNVRVRGDAGRAEAAVERYIGKLRGMTPFDMRKAQRYLLLASDIAGVQIRAAVRPSITGERGAVDMDITVIAHPVDAVANIQNDGSRTVGRFAGLARVDVDSLTDFGDRSSLVASHTLTNDEQWVIQLLEEARLGGDGLILRGSVVYGETRPGGATAELDLVSQSFVSEAEAAYPLIRSRRYNLNLAGGFDLIDAFTNAAGAPLYRDKLRVFYGRVDGDARFLALRRVFQVSGAFSVRKGVDGLGSSTPGVDESLTAIPTTRPQGRPNAWLVRSSADLTVPVFDRLVFGGQIEAQYTSVALLDYEQLALGDLTVGRGYDPAAVLGDSGVSGAFDLRYGPIQLHPLAAASPYVFYDAGHVHDNGVAVVKDRTLTSAGVGVLFRLANRVNLDLAYAVPFQAPTPGGSIPDPRLMVNLTVSVL